MSSFQYRPYFATCLSDTASDSRTILGQSGVSTSSSDDRCDARVSLCPTVIYRNKRACRVVGPSVDVGDLINKWRYGAVVMMGARLKANKTELDAVVHALIVDTNILELACSSHGGLLIGTVLKLITDIRRNILLEVLASNPNSIWELATKTVALQNIYDIADVEWKCRLHQVLIPRFSELCYHPQGNYMFGHMLRAYPSHQDGNLLDAATAMFSDGTELLTLCQDRAAVCVTIVWASVLTPSLAQVSARRLLEHPKAAFIFFRLAMSNVAHKVVGCLLKQLMGGENDRLIRPILKHIRGARYTGKIHPRPALSQLK